MSDTTLTEKEDHLEYVKNHVLKDGEYARLPRKNELLLDFDSPSAKKRFQTRVETLKADKWVTSYTLWPSKTRGHYHASVLLPANLRGPRADRVAGGPRIRPRAGVGTPHIILERRQESGHPGGEAEAGDAPQRERIKEILDERTKVTC